MDFYQIELKMAKKDTIEIYPDFKACRSKDLMIRGRSFYAIWDSAKQMWSTDEYDIQRLIDEELEAERKKIQKKYPDQKIEVKKMLNFSSNMWKNYRTFIREMSDNSHQLDNNLTFVNSNVKKTDYASRRLSYSLEEGKIDAYDELMSKIYDPEEREKLEWAIGAIIAGDAKNVQKFIVLYGEAGSGKSTFLNIIQKLFDGYYTTFEAKALTSTSNAFSTEVFRTNPLVAIQHDGDLSRIEDNTKLNSIISHEEMTMNEKYKPSYMARSNAFLFMGTNKPVKITDAKSGIIRRLIDVRPSGNKIATKRYHTLMSQINFELGAIAWYCLQRYREMGKNYYSSYRPLEMMFQTDVFFNFVEAQYHIFKEQNSVSLTQAYDMYKTYCDESLVEFKLARHKFREELKSYFGSFSDMTRVDGKQIRNYYSEFLSEKFISTELTKEEAPCSLVLDESKSILDKVLAQCPAQYTTEKETPEKKWIEVNTRLSDISTKKLHYVRPPSNHIVIDFDLKDDSGKKSMGLNLAEASKWPTTYAEFSKSEAGIHLHYIYDGDIKKLSRVYSEGIEIKIFTGQASLRRKLSKCNNSPIATINSGLPLKGEKMINFDAVQSERGLRDLITRNLNKEIHPGTKSSIDFIHKILEDANKSGMKYDVTDMRPRILSFANNSTNQADYCIKLVTKMQFASEEPSRNEAFRGYNNEELIFFDVEVFPNLFVVCWKKKGGNVVKMINPVSSQMEELMKFMLVGFNCRRYDNHILYARYIGYTNNQLYELSQKIISNSRNAMFGEAYNISYTDVYDFASAGNKMSLKKWEIKLGIHHQELGLPWDKEVPENMWDTVADYCCNDVNATEAVFEHLAGDWAARQILAELSGLSVNDTTNQHTIKIVFGNDKKPQSQFVYPILSKRFPGYTFENGVSTYKGMVTGEGGRVYAEPGMHTKVAILDIASQHPTSIEQENLFGRYTKNYSDLKKGRIAIKHKDFDTLKTLLGGKLIPFIEEARGDNPRFTLKDVSNGLKTALNSAYGLTSASFENPFRDPRNKDNVVAKRGALFMIDLQFAVQEKGFKVAHIKTDSIKIPEATKDIIDFVTDFGKQYGYDFEHEATYEKMCLVNDAVYIAKYASKETCMDLYGYIPEDCKKHSGEWTATGAQFAQPYVFKTLFSHEPITFEDKFETKTVTVGALYLDMNENLPADEHDYHFVGKAGAFCPVRSGCGGGMLLRVNGEKHHAATGSKGYRWLEAEMVKELGKEGDVDRSYYDALVDNAVEDISKYGDIEWFMSDETDGLLEDRVLIGFDETPPGSMTCGRLDCKGCINWVINPGTGNECKLGHNALPF